ncbi:LysR family transcriptional regulator [Paracoccus sp. MBLB3053]|uniref:LysR family transcriptional regulator n=1 Tax=Paracoccus aurantius TaxID=3073814 RepID=A0ABU2I0N9_9RHOB|nr:LysR family transcriptional regulator [Paracoccus sp. MBLB3053]MDS9470104.1 LysR family transcriptional regulator [Paracoccus sp. MBLB3053]
MLTSLTAADLRALRVFEVIHQCGSFAAAERQLDVSQSTISAQISGLEKRLGFRLCDRGPGGFRLTERGRSLLEANARLNVAMEDFTQTAADLSRRAVGTLRLGLMDHVSADPRFPVVELLRQFHERAPDVNVEIVQDIQTALADQVQKKALDLAIGAFPMDDPNFDFVPLYNERQFIHCGPSHPLFHGAPHVVDAATLEAQRWVRRSYYLTPEDGFPLSLGPAAATAANLEAVAIILGALPVLGYLPPHAAAPLAARGQIRRVTDSYSISFPVSLLSRASRRETTAMKRFRLLAENFSRSRR